MLLSIITPCKNDQKELLKCIISTKIPNINLEHIIFDASPVSLFKNEGNMKLRYPHIKYFHEHDKGPANAIKKGLSISKGKFVLFLMANDSFVKKNCIKIVNILKKNNPDVLVGGYIWKDINSNIRKNSKHQNTEFKLYNLLYEEFYLSRIIIRRNFINTVGGINKKLDIANDRDLFLKIYLAAKKIHYCNISFLNYNFNSSSISNSNDKKTKVKIINEHIIIADNLLSVRYNLDRDIKIKIREWKNFNQSYLIVLNNKNLPHKILLLFCLLFYRPKSIIKLMLIKLSRYITH